jgi:hypothetical protein
MNKNMGSTLLIVLFIALVALAISISMMQLTTSKTTMAVNNKYALQAYYAAEAGMNKAILELTNYAGNLQTVTNADLNNLADENTKAAMGSSNDIEYYVELQNQSADQITVSATGEYKGFRKRLISRLERDTSSAFDYGLLSDKYIDISTGKITFQMDIHTNCEIFSNGNADNYDRLGTTSTATASALNNCPSFSSKGNSQGSGGKGNTRTNEFWGVYGDEVDVPDVNFTYFYQEALTDGWIFTAQDFSSTPNLRVQTTGTTLSALPFERKETYIANTNLPANYVMSMASLNINTKTAGLASVNMPAKPFENIIGLAIRQFGLFDINNYASLYFNNNYAKYVIAGGQGKAVGHEDDPDPTPEPTPEPTPDDSIFEDPDDVDFPDEEAGNEDDSSFSDESSDDSGNKGKGGGNDNSNSGNNNASGGPGDYVITIDAGDYGGKVLYIDNPGDASSIEVNFNGIVKNLAIIVEGDGALMFHGADLGSGNPHDVPDDLDTDGNFKSGHDHRGIEDFIIAANGNIEHYGRLVAKSGLYWTNGAYSQNGRDTYFNSRIIAKGNISSTGRFTMLTDGNLTSYDFAPTIIKVISWREVPISSTSSYGAGTGYSAGENQTTQ